MGGVLAEKLRRDGHDVTLVTPAADVSHWTHNTLEQARIQRRMLELGVEIVTQHELGALSPGQIEVACVFTGRPQCIACESVVLITSREPADGLAAGALRLDPAVFESAGIASVTAIGDCLAPSTIAAAVYAGHKFARGLDQPALEGVPFKRELPALD